METFQGCTACNIWLYNPICLRDQNNLLIIYQGCDHFVSRRYTIDNITISPSNPYATVIQDFRFSLPTSFSENASLWAVLSGKRTNAFFIALCYLLINAEGFLWFKEENVYMHWYNEDTRFYSGADYPIRNGSKAWSTANTVIWYFKRVCYNKKSFKSLMHKKKFII